MNKINRLKNYLLLTCFVTSSALAIDNRNSESDLWESDAPLPKTLFDQERPCERMHWSSSRSSTDINGVFLLDATYGVKYLLHGVCLEAAGDVKGALNQYDQSKKQFVKAVDFLGQNLENRRLTLESREKMYASLATTLDNLLGGTSKSASRQMNKEIFRQVVKIATDSEISDIRKDLKNPAFSSPTGFTNTMRIPVIPVAGFLKLITQIKLPTGGHCTGSFVGPKIVLTNLHCVKNGIKVVRDHIVFREEYSVKTWWTFRGERGTLTLEESKGDSTRGYGNDDWALIEINESRPDPDDYLVVPAKTPLTTNVMIAGYSSDVSDGKHVSLDLNCPVEKVDANFQYRCSTYKGSSGSPIISMYDQRLIVALNNASSLGQVDTANSRAAKFGVRVEKFAPKLYELLGTRPPQWTESNIDARTLLVHAKVMIEQRGKSPNLPKWD